MWYLNGPLENRNPADINGHTPLHNAAFEGHLEIVKFMIPHLEEKNPSNIFGSTPLSLAKETLNFDVVHYLKRAIHNQNHVKTKKESNVSLFKKGKKRLRRPGQN